MLIYKIMKFLRMETICKKIEDKYEKRAKKAAIEIPKERECRECQYGRYIRDNCILACGYECRLNPLKPIILGFEGKHSAMMKKIPYIFDSAFPNEEVTKIALEKEEN